jgi:hypothetical protein
LAVNAWEAGDEVRVLGEYIIIGHVGKQHPAAGAVRHMIDRVDMPGHQ